MIIMIKDINNNNLKYTLDINKLKILLSSDLHIKH